MYYSRYMISSATACAFSFSVLTSCRFLLTDPLSTRWARAVGSEGSAEAEPNLTRRAYVGSYLA
jgi:hypothetical protein